MKGSTIWVIVSLAIAATAGVLYYRNEIATPESAGSSTLELPVPQPDDAAQIRHPVPGAGTGEAEPALPALGDSDPALLEALSAALGQEVIDRFLIPKSLIRRIVATIDGIPRKKIPLLVRPVIPTPGKFITSGTDEQSTLDPQNYTRYAPFVRLVEAADAQQLAAVYLRFYPLFQQAYQDLGYPSGYFNDRLVEVIDHLLETPEVQGPIALVQPGVLFEFAQPDLEARSAGQKVLIRMGTENAAAIKTKLREIRAAVSQAAKQ